MLVEMSIGALPSLAFINLSNALVHHVLAPKGGFGKR